MFLKIKIIILRICLLMAIIVRSTNGTLNDTSSLCTEDSTSPTPTHLTPTPFTPINITSLHLLHPNTTTDYRRQFIVNLTREAWQAYVTYAWGYEALQPLSQNSDKNNKLPQNGETIIQSITTLWLMGLTEEFEKAETWIREEMNVSSVKLENIGALLSAYSLTGNEMFKERAAEIADHLHGEYSEKALESAKSTTNFRKLSRLSEFLRQKLSFRYLADLTGEPEKYWAPIQAIDEYFRTTANPAVNYTRSNWLALDLRSYTQQNQVDLQGLTLYREGMSALESDGKIFKSRSNLTFILDAPRKMHQVSCGFGAFLTYGAAALEKAQRLKGKVDLGLRATIRKHRSLAQQLTETCHLATNGSRLGLTTTVFLINDTTPYSNQTIIADGNNFLLPHLLESYFILYRFTKNPKYRDYAWELVQSITRHCRNENGGYSQMYRVKGGPTSIKRDYQPSYFIGATLEYLYLLFSNDAVLPLDGWVFNAAGSPLPIYGKNEAYPKRGNGCIK